jgi:hypothetical protein
LIKSQENYHPWYVARESRRVSMHVTMLDSWFFRIALEEAEEKEE